MTTPTAKTLDISPGVPSKSPRRQRAWQLIALFVTIVTVCGALDISGGAGFDWLELYLYKMRAAMHAQRHPGLSSQVRQQVIVVTISDDTFKSDPAFQKLHGPPVPRDYHAKVVRELTRAGAKVIAFDLVFDIPKAQDKQLAEAARKSGKVLWASLFEDEQQILPNPKLLQAAPHYGHILIPKDADHPLVDSVQVLYRDSSGKLQPSFSLKAALIAKGLADEPIRRVTGGWQAGDFFIPADDSGKLQISYFGKPEDVFPPYPYENIYLGAVDEPFIRQTHFFRDKIVLIGDTTKVGNDMPYTPVGTMAGVEVHAHAIATLLQGHSVHAAASNLNLLSIAVLTALVCLCTFLKHLWRILLIVVFLSVAYPCLNVVLFIDRGFALHLTGPLVALVLTTLGVLMIRGFSYERERAQMFDALVFAAASAIEDRDPTTSGHSRRVTQMTIGLACAVNEARDGRFKKVRFSHDELRALSYAGQLHDFGKIGVREAVLVKSHKVEPLHFQTIKDRLLLFRSATEKYAAQRQIEVLLQCSHEEALPQLKEMNDELMAELTALDDDLLLLERANDPTATFLPDEQYEDLQALLNRLEKLSYKDETGTAQPLLTPEEKDALSIRRGSLTREEYQQVQDHAQMSYNFLSQIPWTEEMAQIPSIAYAHHEKMDGSGYPRGLKDEQIPLQARIMTVADIYDALTASDRPYKKAMPVERAFAILREEANRGQLDSDLVELFINREVHKYAEATRPVMEIEKGRSGLHWWKKPLTKILPQVGS